MNLSEEEEKDLIKKRSNCVDTDNQTENPPTGLKTYILIIVTIIVIALTVIKLLKRI